MALGEIIKKYMPFTGRGLRDDDSIVNILDELTQMRKGIYARLSDSSSLDAFSRLRVSLPNTLFDAQQEYGLAMVDTWDAAANSTYSPIDTTDGSVADGATLVGPTDFDTTMTPIASGATTGNRAVLQSRQYIRYIPGKSQLIFITGVFAESASDTASIVLRSSTSGSPVEREFEQADWNIDKMDGTGPSEVTIDFTKDQILVIDAQWLAVGRVRVGFDIGGTIFYVHEYLHANVISVPYTQTFNLPVRCQSETFATETQFEAGYFDLANGVSLRITKTGQGGTFNFICCSVQSEGGEEARGFPNSALSPAGRLAGNTTPLPILSIRPKILYNDRDNRIHTEVIQYLTLITGGDAYVEIYEGATTVGGTWADADATSSIEVNYTGTSITGGKRVKAGFGISGAGSARGALTSGVANIRNPLTLSQIDDLPARQIELTVVVTAFSGSVTARASLDWNEQRL